MVFKYYVIKIYKVFMEKIIKYYWRVYRMIWVYIKFIFLVINRLIDVDMDKL